MLPCPVCKADNAQGPSCRRCKADLSLLFQLEEQRDRLLTAAAEGVRAGRRAEALANARHAHRLRRGPDSGRLLALLALLRQDYVAAWRLWEQVGAS